MTFQAFRTDERSRIESLPAIDLEGNIATIDGRIDNYAELADLLGSRPDTPDSSLVLGAFRRWGTQCFERFIGDWAISICSASNQEIFLAKDHAGTRSLYFANGVEGLRWSTYLDSFFFDAGPRRCLDETYIASFLTLQPLRDLTPIPIFVAFCQAIMFDSHEVKSSRLAIGNPPQVRSFVIAIYGIMTINSLLFLLRQSSGGLSQRMA